MEMRREAMSSEHQAHTSWAPIMTGITEGYSDSPFHYMDRDSDEWKTPETDFLCFRAGGKSLDEPYVINYTTIKSMVTCKDCIEWMCA